MTPPVFEMVSASADCRSIFGDPPRLYQDEAPPRRPVPYIVWQMPTSVPANYLGDLPDMDAARVQFDVYDTDQETVVVSAKALRDALEPYGHMLNSSSRPRNESTRHYGHMLEFEFFTPR